MINALIALVRNKPNWQFIVSAPRSIDQEAARRFEQFPNIVLEVSPTKIFSKINYFWVATNFRRSVKTNKADLIWYPAAMSLPLKPKKVKELVTVHFAGYLTNEQLCALYNTVDCFVSTSLKEGFGMPQLEAIFAGQSSLRPTIQQ